MNGMQDVRSSLMKNFFLSAKIGLLTQDNNDETSSRLSRRRMVIKRNSNLRSSMLAAYKT